MLLSLFKKSNIEKELLKDIEESERELEKIKEEIRPEVEEINKLPNIEKEKIKEGVELNRKLLERKLESLRLKTLYFIILLSNLLSITVLITITLTIQDKVPTTGIIITNVILSISIIGLSINFIIKEKLIQDKIKKLIALSLQIK